MEKAEETCSQLLRAPGLARPLRQKASYRRALSRQHQATEAGVGETGAKLARRAYRDAYVAMKLSQQVGSLVEVPIAVGLSGSLLGRDDGHGIS